MQSVTLCFRYAIVRGLRNGRLWSEVGRPAQNRCHCSRTGRAGPSAMQHRQPHGRIPDMRAIILALVLSALLASQPNQPTTS